MTDPLPLARFRQVLDAYGADPRRWPEAERAAALALVRSQPEAAALLDAAGEIDDLLAAYVVPAPSAAFARRVLAAAPGRRLKQWLVALALALAGGGGVLAGSAAAAVLAPAGIMLPAWDRPEATAFGDLDVEDA